jgi:hypothetical protein
MIQRGSIDSDVAPMLAWVLSQIKIDPVGRINPMSGEPRRWGAVHTIDHKNIVFKPLIDRIHEIAKTYFVHYHISDIWSNFNPPGSPGKRHNHVDSSIAGCYYLSVPDNSGSIEFETGEEFFPNPGEILWWPADIVHWANKNNSQENRYSVAFNIKED